MSTNDSGKCSTNWEIQNFRYPSLLMSMRLMWSWQVHFKIVLNCSLQCWNVQSDCLSSTSSFRCTWISTSAMWICGVSVCNTGNLLREIASATMFLAPCTCTDDTTNLKWAVKKNKQHRNYIMSHIPCLICIDCLHYCIVITLHVQWCRWKGG